MATDVSMEQLVGALLDAQNRCNNLLGAMFNHMREDSRQKSGQEDTLAMWKANNPDLSKRCGKSSKILAEIQKAYLSQVLDELEFLNPDNEFEVREFLDRFGQGFMQLNGILHTVAQLSS